MTDNVLSNGATSAQENRQFCVTSFDSRQSTHGRALTLTWPKLRELIATDAELTEAKDGLSLVFGEIKPDAAGQLRHKKSQIVALHALGVDIDDAPEDAAIRAIAALADRGLEFVGWPTHGQLSKPKEGLIRCRIVIPLSEPVPAERWPAFWGAALEQLGLTALADGQCRDCSRLFFLTCPPDKLDQFDKWHALLSNDGAPLDVTKVPVRVAAAPAQSERRIDLNAPDVVRGFDGVTYQKAPKGTNPFSHAEHLCRTMPPSISGQKGHVALLRVARALCWGLELEAAQARIAISELYNPRCDPPWSESEIDHKIEAAEQESGAPFARGALLPAPPDSFDHLPYVVCNNGRFWLRDYGSDDFDLQCSETDLIAAVRGKYANDPATPIHVPEGDHPKVDHVKAWAAFVPSVAVCYWQSKTTYDPTHGELTVGLRTDPRLVSRFDPQVETWLAALAGDRLQALKQWIAACRSDRLSAPARALGICAQKETGKSLIAAGLARIWGDLKPVAANVLCSRFNASLSRCPIVLADETLPADLMGEAFREHIAARTQEIEPKGKERATLRGAIRLVVAVNNLAKFYMGGSKNANDVGAIADRLFVIDVPDDRADAAREALVPLLGEDGSNVDRVRLAQHFLHIMATVEPARGRFIGAPEDDTAFRVTLAAETANLPELWSVLREYFESHGAWDRSYSLLNAGTVVPKRGEVSAEGRLNFPIVIRGGRLFVRVGALGQCVGQDVSTITKALGPFRIGGRTTYRIDGAKLDVVELDAERLAAAVEIDGADLAATLSVDTLDRRSQGGG